MRPIVVRQRQDNDCGLAAIATVSAHHGVPVDYEALSRQVVLEKDGTDLLTLSRLAARLGMRVQGIKTSYDAIATCQLPAIAHVRHRFGANHFVVLHRWTPQYAVIADPAKGLRKLSRKAFCRQLTGYLLLIHAPTDSSPV